MRPDMCKVIVERPRPASFRHVPRRMRRLDPKKIALSDEDDDRFPSRIGHRRAAALSRHRKWLNENLAPLRRYLHKQVGRPWDQVWSEISRHVRPDNTVQQHVRDHIQDFVAYRTFEQDGTIFMAFRSGAPMPLSGCRWLRLYVDPRTGLLSRMQAPTRFRERTARKARERGAAHRLRIIDEFHQLHLLDDGNWWEVTLARDPSLRRNEQTADVVDQAGLSSLPRAERYLCYGVHATTKRPLSHKEIKARRLRG